MLNVQSLRSTLNELLDHLPEMQHGALIAQALGLIARISQDEIDRLDWKILNASLQDMERAFTTFYPYRHIRKVSIFGSARIKPGTEEYEQAKEFAKCVTQQGYMVITGAGGGIMAAGNEGAGMDKSFGLNIQLPFEQGANHFIQGDPKLIPFKYFFTRKVFFLKESDALALFPGGFGTQDEAFECLTLTQTGKSAPVPLVLIDKPGGHYWHDWSEYIHKQLMKRGLISADDPSLYTITDDLDVACNAISSFYQVYHSSRYVGSQLVLRLKTELSDAAVDELNDRFRDILVTGRIEKTKPLPQEAQDESYGLPRLILNFNQRDLGRLYQLIAAVNFLGNPPPEVSAHPERK
ncbi:LOG family protein [Leptolyngbya sp. FACHB-402]|nr:LOG family protein [Leptolyngbya sp. FACHB-1624]MBD2370907.1 LOG family protein [Leptolyngbya sp. FACHB-161]MBD2377421.1 LOG family protein [Leptolyngbya sp. FACHB-238]MBD2401829.1 LOG family protein [Leptolyngbya sp. FACHB-239]MBD2408348.1 LOG family protein [Leptolyngbya sp. FACHB-402]MBN8564159.1 LOG family protein [Leptolyngbya sp. UWPOB_LEPTO1]